MINLTPAQLMNLGNWGLTRLYLDIVERAKFVGYAKSSYQLLLAQNISNLSQATPTESEIVEKLRTKVLFDASFERTVKKRDPFLDFRDHSKRSRYWNLADLFSSYVVSKEWQTISN